MCFSCVVWSTFLFSFSSSLTSLHSTSMASSKRSASLQDLNFSDHDDLNFSGDDDTRRKPSSAAKRAAAAVPPSCQADICIATLADAKSYHRRHKVCEFHAKAPAVVVAGLPQRFCQQCSRFHEVSEFDDAKRSCRRRLACHNQRRRKSSTSAGEASGDGDEVNETQCRDATDERANSAAYKNFQIR